MDKSRKTSLCLGGPASEVSSFAWHIALNLTFAPAFEGLEQYEILGTGAALFPKEIVDLIWLVTKQWMYGERSHPTP